MKVLKKVFAFAIALTAIAMASSAMAADATYAVDNAGNATVTVNADISGTNQTTVAVVPTTFGDETEAVADDIYYINQGTTDEIKALLAAGVGLKNTLDVPAAFEVRVGGETQDVYAIPAVVPSIGDGSSNEELTQSGSVEGTSKLAFDGSLTVNGAGLTRLKFSLTAKEAGKDDLTAVFYSNDEGVVFDKNIASIFGTVTFGLEIDNVPAGVTVTLDAVDVVK